MPIYMIDDVSLLIGPLDCPEIPGLGTPVPGNAIELDAELPPADAGFVWVWIEGKPQQLTDQRGVVYLTESGARQEWTLPGDLPSQFTAMAWPGEFYKWKNSKWQLDENARAEALTRQALEERDSLLAIAAIRIAPLQDAVDLEKATGDEKAALLKWKGYRVDLNRIEEQEGFPLEFDWPTQPELRNSR